MLKIKAQIRPNGQIGKLQTKFSTITTATGGRGRGILYGNDDRQDRNAERFGVPNRKNWNFSVPLIAYIERKAELCPRCGSFAAIHRKMYYSSLRPQSFFSFKYFNALEVFPNLSSGSRYLATTYLVSILHDLSIAEWMLGRFRWFPLAWYKISMVS